MSLPCLNCSHPPERLLARAFGSAFGWLCVGVVGAGCCSVLMALSNNQGGRYVRHKRYIRQIELMIWVARRSVNRRSRFRDERRPGGSPSDTMKMRLAH